MNYFNGDFDREKRVLFPEIIYGEYKTCDQLKHIICIFSKKSKNILVTRLQKEKGLELKQFFSEGTFHELSGVFTWIYNTPKNEKGLVAIVSAGTSDTPVVEEAALTLSFLGVETLLMNDVGVAGIHRLTKNLERLEKANVIICVAGFEGALPSVLGGLVPQPIISVPTSVGYGVSKGGHTALNSMLSSCASGITVVNIDNGMGAALAAFRILKNLEKYENT